MKWRVAVLFDVDAKDEQDAYEKAEAVVAGDLTIDVEYAGVWTERADPMLPLGPVRTPMDRHSA